MTTAARGGKWSCDGRHHRLSPPPADRQLPHRESLVWAQDHKSDDYSATIGSRGLLCDMESDLGGLRSRHRSQRRGQETNTLGR